MRNNIVPLTLLKGTKVLMHTSNGEINIIAERDVVFKEYELQFHSGWLFYWFKPPYPTYQGYNVHRMEWEENYKG